MLAFEQAQILDVIGPLEVFARASRWLHDHRRRQSAAYVVEIVGSKRGLFTTSSGLALQATRSMSDVDAGVDTLMIAGGVGVESCRSDQEMLAWLQSQATKVRRMASICTGGFLLAEAGLLQGKSVTTHWGYCSDLARQFPELRVQQDCLFARDGNVYTSAGVTAGMDLALAMVEEDFGGEVALATARELVLYIKRSGGQSQLSPQMISQLPEADSLQGLQAHIQAHPASDLGVNALAARVAMSPRNFARRFVRETGQSPARYVSSVRVDMARRLLEETSEPLERICKKCGLGTVETMRRTFLRTVGICPSQYRQRLSDH